jgi:DNA polymerase-3 subunit delta'
MTELLGTVRGQETAVGTLRRALAVGKVHHAYLFDGPDGVGKELAAIGLAQALLCERRPDDGDHACGVCSACERVTRGQAGETGARSLHPDLVLLERGLYEPAMIGRRTPETQDLSIDQVRTLVLARAAFSPHEGKAKVFVLRRAEELSVSAANALLKTLEEPGQRTHFVLLSAQAESLLATIRSRTQRVRFGPLGPAVVAELLVARGVDPATAAETTELAGGRMKTALARAGTDEGAELDRRFVERARASLVGTDASGGFELAEEGKKNKAELWPRLEALAASFALEARAAAGQAGPAAERAVNRYRLTQDAMRQLDANGSPQLVIEAMFLKLRG